MLIQIDTTGGSQMSQNEKANIYLRTFLFSTPFVVAIVFFVVIPIGHHLSFNGFFMPYYIMIVVLFTMSLGALMGFIARKLIKRSNNQL